MTGHLPLLPVEGKSAAEATPVELFRGTVIDRATGQVESTFSCDPGQVLALAMDLLKHGKGMVEGHVEFDKLVDPETGLVRDRDAWAYTIETNTITGLPPSTMAIVEGRKVEVGGTALRLWAGLPQTLMVKLISPLCGEAEVMVPCEPVAGKKPADAVALERQDPLLLRSESYPAIGDQLDLIIKGLAKIPAAAATPEIKAVIEASAAVKSKFPKG